MATSNCYELIECSHQIIHNNCNLCGVFVKNGVEGYKTERYRNSDQVYSIRYLKSLRKSHTAVLAGRYPFPEKLYCYLERIIEKFQFGMETLALSIYIFNSLYEASTTPRLFEQKMNLYAGACLMIAGKAIQLDKRVPYYSRFQKYADTSYSKEEYESLEMDLLAELEFKIQIPTFVTFLNYYLSNGLLLSNDPLNKRSAFILEEKVKELTFKTLKSGDFVTKNQEKQAFSLVLKARKDCHLGYNQSLSSYSLLNTFDCEDILALHSLPL